MTQPSVACYFNTRKRALIEDNKVNHARKVLILDEDSYKKKIETKEVQELSKNSLKTNEVNHVVIKKITNPVATTQNKITKTAKSKNHGSKNIQEMLSKMGKPKMEEIKETIESTSIVAAIQDKNDSDFKTPPSTPTKVLNAMDRITQNPSLLQIKKKLTKSSRLAELKASISRLNQGAEQLKNAEKKTAAISDQLKLKSFKAIELEVQLSPQKVVSPEKAYLSPKKDATARRNLFASLSPTKIVSSAASPSKEILESISKPALTLPFKYRYFAEIFRSIDTIAQILFNRKETITFNKLKPAVEDMLKRNLTLKHLAQIKFVYPNAFEFKQEKLRVFGTGSRSEQWELVLIPKINTDHITSEDLLHRRRNLFNILIEKVKNYHEEFLSTLDPPMVIAKIDIKRWHPEFDLEKVPDIEQSDVPQPPIENKLTTGKEVLEKAREIFKCNTRMEEALQRLKSNKEASESIPGKLADTNSLLKGIPKALLEKVRQKQAAKALISMTRSTDKEKIIQLYSRLPEIARLIRNLFVSEKKGVLTLESVIEKLGNSYRSNLTKIEMEEHLRVVAKEVPGWLVFHDIRNTMYLKLAKNADLSLVLDKLEKSAKEKNES